jgi:methyl-accepting chemotaxis protein
MGRLDYDQPRRMDCGAVESARLNARRGATPFAHLHSTANPVDYALAQTGRANTEYAALRGMIDGLAKFIGQPMARLLGDQAELVAEAADEAGDGLARGVDQRDEQIRQLARNFDDVRSSFNLMRGHVEALSDELARRAERAKRPVPEIVTAARAAAETVNEPF